MIFLEKSSILADIAHNSNERRVDELLVISKIEKTKETIIGLLHRELVVRFESD